MRGFMGMANDGGCGNDNGPQEEPIECTSEEGITAGLIDAVIACANSLQHRDLKHPEIQRALQDLRQSKNVQRLFGQAFGPGYDRQLANFETRSLEEAMLPKNYDGVR
jgi:hypothetical protein